MRGNRPAGCPPPLWNLRGEEGLPQFAQWQAQSCLMAFLNRAEGAGQRPPWGSRSLRGINGKRLGKTLGEVHCVEGRAKRLLVNWGQNPCPGVVGLCDKSSAVSKKYIQMKKRNVWESPCSISILHLQKHPCCLPTPDVLCIHTHSHYSSHTPKTPLAPPFHFTCPLKAATPTTRDICVQFPRSFGVLLESVNV